MVAALGGGALTPGSTSGGGQRTPFELLSLSLSVSFVCFEELSPCLLRSLGLLLRWASVAGSEQGFGSTARGGTAGASVPGPEGV